MLTIGRLCIKTAGRDSGKIAVIANVIDDNYVLIDGNVRRKKCNIKHLEPLPKTINIEKEASTDLIKKELSNLGIKIDIKKKFEKVKNDKK